MEERLQELLEETRVEETMLVLPKEELPGILNIPLSDFPKACQNKRKWRKCVCPHSYLAETQAFRRPGRYLAFNWTLFLAHHSAASTVRLQKVRD